MRARWELVMGTAFAVLMAAPAAGQDAKVATGEALYAAQKCSVCHSVDGKGNKKFPLDGAGATVSPDIITLWLTDPKAAEARTGKAGRPAMRSYAKLSSEKIDALVAYVLSLK